MKFGIVMVQTHTHTVSFTDAHTYSLACKSPRGICGPH